MVKYEIARLQQLLGEARLELLNLRSVLIERDSALRQSKTLIKMSIFIPVLPNATVFDRLLEYLSPNAK